MKKTKLKSLRIDEDVWLDFKKYCINQRKSMSEILTEMIMAKIKGMA